MQVFSLGTMIFQLVTFALLLALLYFVIKGIIFFSVQPKVAKKQHEELLRKLSEISEKLDRLH